tara:strand:+ start:1160 stop:1372 length:213 start_codon:yes stop_codon:yes gene_type:complete
MLTETEKTEAAIKLLRSVAEAIRDLGEVPSGELYARLMEFLSLDEYNKVIGVLKKTGLITETNYLLKWKG